jgi:hypothetical protein
MISQPSKMLYATYKPVLSVEHAVHKPILMFCKFLLHFLKLDAKFDHATLLKILFLHFRNMSLHTHLHNSLLS